MTTKEQRKQLEYTAMNLFLLVTFEECEEDAEIAREMISKISSYAAAVGTAHCENDAKPAFEDTTAASNEVAQGVRKDHSETCSREADSSSESEGVCTIKTNRHLSSAMTPVLNLYSSLPQGKQRPWT